MVDNDEYVDIPQAAQELGLGQSTVWLLLKDSDIPRFRIPGEGKRVFLRRADLPKLKRPIPIGTSRRGRPTKGQLGKAVAAA
jgi:hypothetical protein